jgi:nucleoside-diphosphate-sugar epimerase
LGFTGRAIAQRLLAQGWRVSGTGRAAPEMEGVRGISFDGAVSAALSKAVAKADVIVSAIPPAREVSDPVLEALPELALTCRARAVIYLSATSVYGNRDGQWVFEEEAPRPQTERGRARAEAELRWLETGLPVHVLRLAGIYGPGRSAFEKMERAVIKPDHVVNRIHVEDIADLISRIAAKPAPGIYNVADGHPAPPQDVVKLAAQIADAPPPREVAWTDPELSAMARSFYGETKRVDISKVAATFGWAPRYTDYRAGLAQIFAVPGR